MNKTLIAGAIMALVSTGAIAGKPVQPPTPEDLTPRVEALEQDVVVLEQEVGVLKQQVGELNAKNVQLESGLSSNQQQVADLEALVTSIHGPTLPPTEPPVNPPPPVGGYVVYDVNGEFVGTTLYGNDVRITLDEYPGIYFRMPAFEREIPTWANETIISTNWLFYPGSKDCSSQPYLESISRYNVLGRASLLDPNPPINAQYGPVVHKSGSTNMYYVGDPNNDELAVSLEEFVVSSYRETSEICVEIQADYFSDRRDLKIWVPVEEVTIDLAYPLQVNFD